MPTCYACPMPKMREHRTVDADFASTGPNATTRLQRVHAPAEAAFDVLADGPAWKEWLGIDVEWTSPEPHGVGTTRTVTTRGASIEETFLVWEPGRRMNFRFDRSTLPVSAFAEDYLLIDHPDGGCTLEWSYSYDWAAPVAVVTRPLFGFGFGRQASRGLTKFAALVESRHGA